MKPTFQTAALLIVVFLITHFTSLSQNQETGEGHQRFISHTYDDTLRSILVNGTNEQVLETYEKLVSQMFRSNPKAVLEYAGLLRNYSDSLEDLKGIALAYRFYASAFDGLGDYLTSVKYWNLLLEAENALKNKKNIAYTYIILAGTYQQLSHYDSAEICFRNSYDLLKEIDDERGLGFYYANLATSLDKQGLLRQALNAKYEALKIADSLGDSLQMANGLSAIGISHARLGEHSKAIEKYENSIELQLKYNHKSQAFHTMSNMGVAYNSLQQKQKALEVYQKSLVLAQEIDYEYGQAIAAMNIGELLIELGRTDSAEQHLEYSEEVFTRLGAKHPLCYNFNALGNYYHKTSDAKSANYFYQKAYDLSIEIDAPDIHRNAAKGLYKIQKQAGNFKSALHYHETYKHYSDSLLNADNITELTKLEEQYKFEQQQKESTLIYQAALDKSQAVIKGKNKLIASIITGLALLAAMLALLIVQYRRKDEAYRALYLKNIEILNITNRPKNSESLKNSDLFHLIEQKMQKDFLYRISDLSMDMMADLLKTNRTYISQAIIDHSGKNFRDYLKSYRIKEAIEILSDEKRATIYSIDAIAQMVGFNSIAPFNQAFKQTSGLTPSQLRSQARE